jgi:hypothetical protein
MLSSDSGVGDIQQPTTQSRFSAAAAGAGISGEKEGRTLYRWSLFALAAGNAADAISSWHLQEANPVLAGSRSEFDARSVALKAALGGVSVVLQHWVLSRKPGMYRPLARINFVIAGALGAVAVHNTTLR